MRRLLEVLLLVLGFSWGLAPLSLPASLASSGQGLGAERTYIEGNPAAPHAVFAPPLFAVALSRWRWRFFQRQPLTASGWRRAERRLFLRLGRLQLEGG